MANDLLLEIGLEELPARVLRAAMEQLLEIVRRDRKFEDDAGRKTLVGLFRLLGNQNPLVTRYRTLLSSTLA